MSARLDISDLVKELCERAGVDYKATTQIVIHPGNMEIRFDTLLRNEHGSFYVKGDGFASSETRKVQVQS